MIIKRLTMHNFGVYAGTNSFEFHGEKPVVLIGGLNGRGKTTFLNAVLLSLYGSNSFAYKESPYNTYGKYLRSFVNASDPFSNTYLELEFQMSKLDTDIYVVTRSWDGLGKRTKEEISIYKNGVRDAFLTSNWDMFIENLLPSALSNFFFFDGEKIAELAVSDTDSQLRDSIRSMLGLSSLDQLKKDIRRNINIVGKNTIGDKEKEELERLRLQRDELQAQLDLIIGEIEENTNRHTTILSRLEEAKHSYAVQGGDVYEHRQELFDKKANLLAMLNQNTENMLEAAASSLPFALVNDYLKEIDIETESELEHKLDVKFVTRFQKILQRYRAINQNYDALERFEVFALSDLSGSQRKIVYDLSEPATLQLKDLCDQKIDSDIQRTKDIIELRGKIKGNLEELERSLSVDINETALKETYTTIRQLEQQQIDCEVQLKALQERHKKAEWNLSQAISEYRNYAERILGKLELQDDSERVLKYSKMSLDILEEFSLRLQRNKVAILARTISDCYHKLANKQNLIEAVQMDSGSLEIEYINSDGCSVPKDSLSAGEKQLMVIAILWALAICSKKKLPVIIDTPLSRLDSEHRKALILNYFPNASEQTIILSTDSEIDKNYYLLLKDNIGDEFTLKYDDSSRSTTISKGYFLGDQL